MCAMILLGRDAVSQITCWVLLGPSLRAGGQRGWHQPPREVAEMAASERETGRALRDRDTDWWMRLGSSGRSRTWTQCKQKDICAVCVCAMLNARRAAVRRRRRRRRRRQRFTMTKCCARFGYGSTEIDMHACRRPICQPKNSARARTNKYSPARWSWNVCVVIVVVVLVCRWEMRSMPVCVCVSNARARKTEIPKCISIIITRCANVESCSSVNLCARSYRCFMQQTIAPKCDSAGHQFQAKSHDYLNKTSFWCGVKVPWTGAHTCTHTRSFCMCGHAHERR